MRHRGRHIAHDLCVGDAAGGANAGAKVIGTFAGTAFAEIEVRRDRRVAMVRQLAHDLGGPLAQPRYVMNYDDPGELSRACRTRVVGFTLIAIVAAKRHHFGLQALIVTHRALPFSQASDRENHSYHGGSAMTAAPTQLGLGQRYRIAL